MSKNRWRMRRAIVLLLLAPGCAEQGEPAARAAQDAIDALEQFTYAAPDGETVAGLQSGEGRRVIYVHGTPGEKEGWADYLIEPPFPAHAIAIDRPGFGGSGPDGPVTDLEAQARALLPLLEPDPEGRKPILVGHSLGGPIVAQAALLKPEGIGALVLVAGSFDPGLEDVHPLQPLGETWPIRALLPRAIRNSNRELLALEPQLIRLAPLLKEILAPIIVLQGGRDSLVPAENVAFLRETFRPEQQVEWIEIDQADHFVIWNNKPRVDDALRRALALIESR